MKFGKSFDNMTNWFNKHKLIFKIVGKYAPIDTSDAGGMNLLDLKSLDWSQKCLDVSSYIAPIKRNKEIKSLIMNRRFDKTADLSNIYPF